MRWAHVDLAGPAMLSKAHLHFNEGGTGFGAALLTQFVRDAPAGAPPADTA